jgi:DNA-binding NarL/FixJ family response regulator
VALVDIQMPVLDGIQATRRITADPALAGVHVVILTNYGFDEHVYTALRAGAAVLDMLTNREREVVTLVARGMSNDEIATTMVISTATAKTHVSRAMTKLRARDRAQLVVLAYETGLVSPAATT